MSEHPKYPGESAMASPSLDRSRYPGGAQEIRFPGTGVTTGPYDQKIKELVVPDLPKFELPIQKPEQKPPTRQEFNELVKHVADATAALQKNIDWVRVTLGDSVERASADAQRNLDRVSKTLGDQISYDRDFMHRTVSRLDRRIDRIPHKPHDDADFTAIADGGVLADQNVVQVPDGPPRPGSSAQETATYADTPIVVHTEPPEIQQTSRGRKRE